LRTIDVYSVTSADASLTSICKVYSQKPHEKATPATSYLYSRIVSDNNDEIGLEEIMTRIARVEFTVVCKEVLGASETIEWVLAFIVDALENALCKFCDSSVISLGTINVLDILGDAKSPIFYDEKNRWYIKKDFLITYIPK